MLASRKTWIAVAALWIAVAPTLWGAVSVGVASNPKDVAPGGAVTYAFSLAHDGAASETFALVVSAPAGWDVLDVPEEVTLAPGETATVSVTLIAADDAAPGTYPITLGAAAASNPTNAGSAGIAARVLAAGRLELTPPEGATARPGESLVYVFQVTNRGNAQDAVELSASSAHDYPVQLSHAALELSPRETRSATVTLTLPALAAVGRDALAVRAMSRLYEGVESEIEISTQILPIGSGISLAPCALSVPVAFKVGLGRDEVTEEFESWSSLSATATFLEGTLDASIALQDPFGPGPLRVDTYSIAYSLRGASFKIGSVTASLTDLVGFSCDGADVRVDSRFVDLALLAGGEDDETRFGGRFSFGPDVMNLGVAYFDARSATARSSAWTGLLFAEPIGGFALRGEGGLGVVDGRRGCAALFGTTLDVEAYFLDASVFSVDTYFPGPRTDTAGVEASQRLLLDNLSFGLSLCHIWNNVARDPTQPTLVTDALGVSLGATPWPAGPALQATLNLDRRRQEDGVPRDEVDSLLGYGVTEDDGPFVYAFSGRFADRADFALGTHERTVTHTQAVGLATDVFSVRLELREEEVVDLAHDVVLSSAAGAAIAVRPFGSPHQVEIDFGFSGNEARLDARFLFQVAEALAVRLGGCAEWERGVPESARFGWSVELETEFRLALPFFEPYGSLTGRVFVDVDGDGLFGIADAPAVAAIVSVGGAEASTDRAGEYRLGPLPAGSYRLSVSEFPAGATARAPVSVVLPAGRETRVDVPLAADIAAAVASDEEAAAETEEPAGAPAAEPAIVEPVVAPPEGPAAAEPPTGEETADAAELAAPPAEEADLATPAAELEPAPDAGDVEPAAPSSTPARPPVADFAYRPVSPTAGRPVAFDASGSVDFDGALVSYLWDFDADGTVDAEGEAVEWTFETAGPRAVTLTVVDAAGMAGSATAEVDVVAAGPDIALVDPAPLTARFTYEPRVARIGEAVRFDGSGSLGARELLAAYEWDFDGDGLADSDAPAAEWTFPAAGTRQVTLTLRAQGREPSSLTLSIPVVEPTTGVTSSQPPIASLQYMPEAPRAGDPVLFNASASADLDGRIVGYAWDFEADGFVDASEPIVAHVFPKSGAFEVRLTAFDNAGNSDSISVTLDIR